LASLAASIGQPLAAKNTRGCRHRTPSPPHAARRSPYGLLWKELVEREEAKPWLDEQARQGSSTPGSQTDAGVLILQAAEPFDLLSAKRTKKRAQAKQRVNEKVYTRGN